MTAGFLGRVRLVAAQRTLFGLTMAMRVMLLTRDQTLRGDEPDEDLGFW